LVLGPLRRVGARMGRPNQFQLTNVTVDTPVIGFTGALGSGCSYLSEGLAQHFSYAYCSLSEVIHQIARKLFNDEGTGRLQDIGNRLREEHGRDVLVRVALTELNKRLPKPDSPARPKGIVVDGIRNTGEVEALRQFPNFFLISVQASTGLRKSRTIGPDRKFNSEDEFLAADARDRDEQVDDGQQVMQCNYLSDIVVLNEPQEGISPGAHGPYKDYITRILYKPHVSLIEHVSYGRLPAERHARPDEALMTAAYVESRRSSCLKRKVGAVIATPKGDIISAGHNDVPETAKACIDDPRYGWCARDVIQEELGQKLNHCPGCGTKIEIKPYSCKACGKELADYRKRCPNQDCRAGVELSYICPSCGSDVFREFVPGAGPERTGRLLDMCRALHAEENAILNLCKVGTVLPHLHANQVGLPEGCVLYSTTFPCNLCANKIVTVGIGKVVYAEPYTTAEAKRVLDQHGVKHERFQGVKSRAYFRLYG